MCYIILHVWLIPLEKEERKKRNKAAFLNGLRQYGLAFFEVSFSLYMELDIGLVGIHNRLNIRQSLYTYVRTM